MVQARRKNGRLCNAKENVKKKATLQKKKSKTQDQIAGR
jgi:hypothetical protein